MSEYWTMAERIICAAMDNKYKYIARDKNGRLRAYANKPQRSNDHYVSFDAWDMSGFITDFKKITWDNPGPIKILDIVKGKAPAVLDEEEIKYLKQMIMPFRKQVVAIVKETYYYSKELSYIIRILYKVDDRITSFNLPPFEANADMYRGMEVRRQYTVDELGLI